MTYDIEYRPNTICYHDSGTGKIWSREVIEGFHERIGASGQRAFASGYATCFGSTIKPTKEARLYRMRKYIKERHTLVMERWMRRIQWTMAILVAPPLLIAIVSLVWRLCAYVVAA